MRVGVLGATDSWYLRDLQRAAAGKHEVLPMDYARLAAELGGRGELSSVRSDRFTAGAGISLTDCDAVLVRTMPPGSLEQVIFRMDLLGRLAAGGVPVVNPPRAVEAAVDKYLCTALLEAAGLPVPRTAVCQTAEQAMDVWERLGGRAVVKPLFGSEGRGICRVEDEALAWRTFTTLARLQHVLYLQEYVSHPGHDLRVLVLGEEVHGMRRSNSTDWRTNVSRGATTEPLEVTPEQASLARRAAAAMGAVIAGVDLLPNERGELLVLEVNAVPGWKALAATLQVDIAARVLGLLETLVLLKSA